MVLKKVEILDFFVEPYDVAKHLIFQPSVSKAVVMVAVVLIMTTEITWHQSKTQSQGCIPFLTPLKTKDQIWVATG